jgi:ankyrin repeat protein
MFSTIRTKLKLKKLDNNNKKLREWLFDAIENGKPEDIARFVSEHGENPELMNARVLHEIRGATALIHAVRCQRPDIVRELLKATYIDLNAIDHAHPRAGLDEAKHYLNSALLAAIVTKQLDIVEMLVVINSLKINAVGTDRRTALMYAIDYCPAAIPLLLNVKSIHVDAQDGNERTVLHHACLRRNAYAEELPNYIMILIAAPKTLLDKADSEGCTPLMIAAQRGDFPLVRALIQAGANIELVNQAGYSAQALAEQQGRYNIGAYINSNQTNFRRSLH